MSHHNIPDHEIPSTEPPPSYEDSLGNNTTSSLPAPPPRPQLSQSAVSNQQNQPHYNSYIPNSGNSYNNSQNNSWQSPLKADFANSANLRPQSSQSFQPPPQHQPIYQRPPQNQSTQQGSPHTETTDLYSNNTKLPFKYSAGEFCNKCKNTGFKEKGKPCMTCWDKHFKVGTYNPNPKMGYNYPARFICKKCANTGVKWKNGRTCSDCFERYAPRNHVQSIPSGYGTQTIMAPPATRPGMWPPSGPPVQVMPGDPRIGGILCHHCRGSGQTRFFLDTEICLMCSGLGRILPRR